MLLLNIQAIAPNRGFSENYKLNEAQIYDMLTTSGVPGKITFNTQKLETTKD
jgi:hypothetical protein